MFPGPRSREKGLHVLPLVRVPFSSPLFASMGASLEAARAPTTITAVRDQAETDLSSGAASEDTCGRMIEAPAARALVRPDPRIATPEPVVPSRELFRFDGHHEWFAIVDPFQKHQAWIFDARFLLSAYECLYGRGCPGTHEEIQDAALKAAIGCCVHGAYFENRADLERVKRVVRQMSPEDWHHASPASLKHFYRREGGTPEEPWWHTRVKDKACIFSNPPGSPAGEGCALHLLSLRGKRKEHFTKLKPRICSTAPFQIVDEVVGIEDQATLDRVLARAKAAATRGWSAHSASAEALAECTSIKLFVEWTSKRWGGGKMKWWCTEAPKAFTAQTSLYQRSAAELDMLLGKKLHTLLVKELARRAAASPPPLVHPMEALARERGLLTL